MKTVSILFVMLMLIDTKYALKSTFRTIVKKQICRFRSLNKINSVVVEPEKLFDVILPTNDDLSLLKVRHSSAHVMAMAVQKIYPEIKVTIGPWIENG
jgi:threonyl-tRNA synthetase